jgi:hypothetical protein
MTTIPDWPGWLKIFESKWDDVGAWILHFGGEAVLLEVPPGLKPKHVRRGLARLNYPVLRWVTASHDHEDHLDPAAWQRLMVRLPGPTRFIHPAPGRRPSCRTLWVGGEALHLLRVAKHSWSDVVTVFRGVAMTGDVELGQLESCNREVPGRTKAASMRWLAGWTERAGYRCHTVFSAHCNDCRTNVDWRSLFTV